MSHNDELVAEVDIHCHCYDKYPELIEGHEGETHKVCGRLIQRPKHVFFDKSKHLTMKQCAEILQKYTVNFGDIKVRLGTESEIMGPQNKLIWFDEPRINLDKASFHNVSGV